MNDYRFDDGTPVDRSHRASRSRKSQHVHRDLAVCRQALRTIMTELMDLPDVWVEEVAPAPTSARLAVRITAAADSRDRILARAGHLRSAVARDLSRRKAPELVLLILPAPSRKGGER